MGALPHPAALLPGAAGACCPRAVGTSVRVWGPALPVPVACVPCEGRLVSGAVPRLPVSGRAICVGHRRAVGAGVRVRGPNTVPLACMPCGGCVPRGWSGPVAGGVACHRCEGRLVSGAVPPQAARPLGRAAGVPRPMCPGCGRSRRGDPAPAPPTACALAGQRCSLWGWRKGVPGGGAFHRCEGRLRPGARPPPTARPVGGLLGSATHVLWARVCGCGGPTLAPLAGMPCGGCVPRGWWGAVPGGAGLPLL